MIPNTPGLTNRQRVEMTTGKGTCGEACHGALFNPLGYAFENYDAIGEYRTMDQGSLVDAADSYTLDGQLQSFKNGVELSNLLANAKETHACYVAEHDELLERAGADGRRASDGGLLRSVVACRNDLAP